MYIDPTLYTGRPAEKRSPLEERCYELLDRLGISYLRVDHEHADTIEMCEQAEALLGCRICKNLFLTNRQETVFYLLLMPGSKPFKTKDLSKQIGSSRLSFAGPDVPAEVTAHLRDAGKIAVLLGSLCAGVLGSLLITLVHKAESKKDKVA